MPDAATPDPRAGIGGNGPPDVAQLLRSTLAEAGPTEAAATVAAVHAELLEYALRDDAGRAAKRDQLAAAGKRWDDARPEITDDDQQAKAGNVVRLLKDALSTEDAARTAAKRPYLEGGKQIDAAWKRRTAILERTKIAMTNRIGKYQRTVADRKRAEQDRLRREADEAAAQAREIEQQQRDVQQAAAAGAPVVPAQAETDRTEAEALRLAQIQAEQQAAELDRKTQVRSDHGVLVTSRRVARVVVVDEALVPDKYWVLDLACIKAGLLKGQDIPGAKLEYDEVPDVR